MHSKVILPQFATCLHANLHSIALLLFAHVSSPMAPGLPVFTLNYYNSVYCS
ncbi:hypothetical protein RSAG8_08551, partial [Rhizoctonia solani AG-8 WAC10335]